MNAVWITIAVLIVGTFASKTAGTLLLGSRDLGERALRVTALVAPALLAALVVFETLGARRRRITLDARAAGVAAAGVAIVARAPMLLVMLLAAAVTAGVRAFT